MTTQPDRRVAELEAEVADLAVQVDQLAYERDDLLEELTRERQRSAALLADVLEAKQAAVDAWRARPCTKIQHPVRDTARDHARRLALRHPGDLFHTYRCPSCPALPGRRVWHVAHCRDQCDDQVVAVGGVVHERCGCRRGVDSELVWACTGHQMERAS